MKNITFLLGSVMPLVSLTRDPCTISTVFLKSAHRSSAYSRCSLRSGEGDGVTSSRKSVTDGSPSNPHPTSSCFSLT